MYRVCCWLSKSATLVTNRNRADRRWTTLRAARHHLEAEVRDTINRGLMAGNTNMDPPLVLAMLPHQAKVVEVGQKIVVHDFGDGDHWEHWIEEVD